MFDFPVSEFVDSGLLHVMNAKMLWPLGLALSVRMTSRDEQLRDEMLPRIRWALSDIGLEDSGLTGNDIDTLSEMFYKKLFPDQDPVAVQGMYLTQFAPPETIVSNLSAEEQEEKRARAAQWTRERLEVLIP